jgi:formylglycine-generating enzyme required for sulfatase activity
MLNPKRLRFGALRKTPVRALRGGSWNNNQHNARAASRNNNNPNNRNNNIGFRVVRLPHLLPLS